MSTDMLTGEAPVSPIDSGTDTSSSDVGQNVSTENINTNVTDNSTGFLPENYASDPSLKDFKNVDALAESYLNLRRQVGRSVVIPGKDAGKEDMDKFYGKLTSVTGVMRTPDPQNSEAMNQFYGSLGRPAEASGYEFSTEDGSLNIDPSTLNGFKEIAHKANLTSEQFKQMIDFDLSRVQIQSDKDQNAATNAISVLQQRWGNEYNNRIAGAKSAFRTYQKQFPEGFSELERVAKNNPALVAILSDIGRSMQEKGFIDAPYAYAGTAPDEAKEKITEIRNNLEHPYHAKNAARVGPEAHKLAKEKMRQLYKQANPN